MMKKKRFLRFFMTGLWKTNNSFNVLEAFFIGCRPSIIDRRLLTPSQYSWLNSPKFNKALSTTSVGFPFFSSVFLELGRWHSYSTITCSSTVFIRCPCYIEKKVCSFNNAERRWLKEESKREVPHSAPCVLPNASIRGGFRVLLEFLLQYCANLVMQTEKL